jgi:hypothetical protein
LGKKTTFSEKGPLFAKTTPLYNVEAKGIELYELIDLRVVLQRHVPCPADKKYFS